MPTYCCSVCRKADLRELKVLQKIEKKQYQDLMLKAQYVRDQQMKKFEQEMLVRQCLCIVDKMQLAVFWVNYYTY